MDAVLLASGGVDSTTLAYWMLSRHISFLPLFIDYSQHTAKSELAAIARVLPKNCSDRLEVVDIQKVYAASSSRMVKQPNLWEDKICDDDLFLPYRNSLLLFLGAAFAESRGIPKLYSGFIDSNRAIGNDSTTAFLREISEICLRYGSVELQMPFSRLTKSEVAKIGIELKVPLAETYSCLASPDVACGACSNCVDRRQAFDALGV